MKLNVINGELTFDKEQLQFAIVNFSYAMASLPISLYIAASIYLYVWSRVATWAQCVATVVELYHTALYAVNFVRHSKQFVLTLGGRLDVRPYSTSRTECDSIDLPND